MIKIKNLINEALPLSKAKELTKGWDNTTNQLWFGKKYRIYLPLIASNTDKKIWRTDIKRLVILTLELLGYTIKDYIAGIATNTKYQRDEKIGKILTRLIKKDKDNLSLLKLFNSDPMRQNTKSTDPIVVISRHPYDIAGMSTDRGWTSCKDLGTDRIYSRGCKKDNPGLYSDYIRDEVHLLLIAYLIYPDDKNITHPIARVNIVPYSPTTVNSGLKDLFVIGHIYGSAGVLQDAFYDTVEQWLDHKQKDMPKGLFGLTGNIYNDNYHTQLTNMTPLEWKNFKWDGDTWKSGLWLGGTWWNGTWQNGVWRAGVWKNGKWYVGLWRDGTWLNGTWQDGTWQTGQWLGGVWKDGEWWYGRWWNGTWENGTWLSGKWLDGTWKDGVWKTGTWKNGKWKNGAWERGTWLNGDWFNGTWYWGAWLNGNWWNGKWKNGTWKNGNWYDGVWKTGTWQDGDWKNGTWKSGTWLNGTWYWGIWLYGAWKGGKWNSGVWQDGTWLNGVWKGGTWKNGTWQDGSWKDGTWKNGKWKTGLIYDPSRDGNFEYHWKWLGEYVHSPINPALYWRGKK